MQRTAESVDADHCDFASGNAILDANSNKIEENALPTTDNAEQMKFTGHEVCSKVNLDNHSRNIFSKPEK